MDLERDHHVINAGVEDHASINAQLRLPRLLAFEPDILIVYIGWNDMWLGNPKHYPDMRRKTQSYWHYGNGGNTGLRLLDEAKEILELNTPPPIGSFDLEDFLPENYEYNMRRLIRTAKDDRIRVVLTTLPTLISGNGAEMSMQSLDKMRYPSFLARGDLDRLRQLYEYLRWLDPQAGHGRGYGPHRSQRRFYRDGRRTRTILRRYLASHHRRQRGHRAGAGPGPAGPLTFVG